MPNTFSMAPNYVRKFVATNRLNRVSRDVFQLLDEKIDRLFREPAPTGSEGIVVAADAKRLKETPTLEPYVGKAKLVVTSPPYLDVVNYSKQNWIRNWLLEESPDSSLTTELDDNLTLGSWLDFVEEIVVQLKGMMEPDGVLVMVIGDVAKASSKSYISLAREFMLRIRHDSVFRYVGCFEDYIGQEGKTTRIWKDTKGRATEVDRLIVLSDETPRFRTGALPEALRLPALSASKLKHITADALAKTAEAFSSITLPRMIHREKGTTPAVLQGPAKRRKQMKTSGEKRKAEKMRATKKHSKPRKAK